MAPQPEESLEAIYEWVKDWDQVWAGIYSWWKYVDKNKISIPKVCDANLHNMTKESVMQQNEMILAAIAIADLHWPEGQRRFHINDVFEGYQEWVEERACLEAERLAKALSVHTWGQTARDEGQDHVPEDTEGYMARGGAHTAGGGSGSTSKGKGKHEEDQLADNVNDDKGNGEGEAPVNEPQASLPIDELQVKPQVEVKSFFVTVTGLLDEPGDVEVSGQSNTPSVAEIPEVEYPHEQSTVNIIECLRVLEARAEDEEFELEQVYWLLEMLTRWVTHQIETAQARWEEL
ncbi:hypothetical protein M404DRAFT_32362 [Pisolithus tinctorius Marx 270]|uniref:Uncharacterized protein n=1 Tax=Pisolithus tinctorius Marx 270 TaxID=870435 RepID=A0A0C3IKD0_PISTI|nr:hypothetical protein M404DRAFT_32362 [Pisolithus tinctorius Marx 270]